MSGEDQVVGYDVTVRGTYQAASGKDRILKTFGPVTFFLPEYVEIPNGKKKVQKMIDGRVVQTWEPQFAKRAATADDVALWVIQRRLLPSWLADHHPDCTTFRTCAIVPSGMKRVIRPKTAIVNLNKSIDDMTLPELKHFCAMKQIPVAVSAFANVEEAREAIRFEMSQQGMEMASAPKRMDAANMEPPKGVVGAEGRIAPAVEGAPDDGVATDQQDAAADLM